MGDGAQRVRGCARRPAHLKLVSDADEAELPGLLLGVSAAGGVLKEPADEAVLGLTHQALQGHVQRVVVLLHKLGLMRDTRTRSDPAGVRPGSRTRFR